MTDIPVPTLRERYERLRRYIGLDLLDIENEFMVTPRIVEEAAELAARAEEAKNVAKHNLELATATAADRIRQPWIAQSAPVTRIESELKIMVPLAPDVIEAREAYTRSIYEADACAGLFTSIKDQSRLLGKAADMLNSGYITPSALQDQRRAEMSAARRAQQNEKADNPPVTRPRS